MQHRFIPTGVGNTVQQSWGKVQNHGSSPRVWGTHYRHRPLIHPKRFIPTGVGNTIKSGGVALLPAVHPHGCGEHAGDLIAQKRLIGSSPRVWGTQVLFLLFLFLYRFIPTGVGNTGAVDPLTGSSPVHPHGCGEHMEKMEI